MTITECLRRVDKICEMTMGTVEDAHTFPEKHYAWLIRQPDALSKRPFYTIAVKENDEKRLKLLTFDEKKDAKKFWTKYTENDENRKEMMLKTREIYKGIYILKRSEDRLVKRH